MGTTAGWETRRRRQAEREKEWDEAIARTAREEERARLRPLLSRCLGLIERIPMEFAQTERAELIADLRRELGLPGDGAC